MGLLKEFFQSVKNGYQTENLEYVSRETISYKPRETIRTLPKNNTVVWRPDKPKQIESIIRGKVWTLEAVIRHSEDTNRIVYGSCSDSYITSKQKCDACGLTNYRKHTFIVSKSDGTIRQIGTSCIADYLDVNDIQKTLGIRIRK